jgi:hypothetical protein
MKIAALFSLNKRFINAVFILPVVATAVLSSCSQDDSFAGLTKEKAQQYLHFDVNLKGSEDKEAGGNVGTRGMPASEFYESFGIYASQIESFNEANQTMNYLKNAEAGEYLDRWQTYNTVETPEDNKKMNFYAYYPYQADESSEEDEESSETRPHFLLMNDGYDDARGLPYFKFTVPEDVTQQVDLMTASTSRPSEEVKADSILKLHFTHMLTGVRFTVDGETQEGYITKITLKNVSDGGTYIYNGFTTWAEVNASVKDFSLETKIKTGTGVTQSIADNEVFMMMPQTLADASVTITFDNGMSIDLNKEFPDAEWLQGKIYTYNIKINSLTKIQLTSTIKDWDRGEDFNWETSF